jgi:hypothetical protein
MRPINVALRIVAGLGAAWLWVWLFGLWTAYDTPLLKFGFGLGFGVLPASYMSLSLFALSIAAVASLVLRSFYRRSLLAAAAIFITAFLAAFIIPAFFESDTLGLLLSLRDLWVFVFFFGLCVSLLILRRHA